MAEVVQRLKTLVGISLLAGSMALPGVVVPAEIDRGQALYENHCKSCHETQLHELEQRRAKSLQDIRRWVATWAFHAKLDWTADEINDVTDFLNRRFYKFTETP